MGSLKRMTSVTEKSLQKSNSYEAANVNALPIKHVLHILQLQCILYTAETHHFTFLCNGAMPHTEFDKALTTFQAAPGNIELTLGKNHNKSQKRYNFFIVAGFGTVAGSSPSGDKESWAKMHIY